MNKLLLSSLLLISTNTLALTSFDPAKQTLTFDRYAKDGKVYKHVVFKITGGSVQSQGGFTLTTKVSEFVFSRIAVVHSWFPGFLALTS